MSSKSIQIITIHCVFGPETIQFQDLVQRAMNTVNQIYRAQGKAVEIRLENNPEIALSYQSTRRNQLPRLYADVVVGLFWYKLEGGKIGGSASQSNLVTSAQQRITTVLTTRRSDSIRPIMLAFRNKAPLPSSFSDADYKEYASLIAFLEETKTSFHYPDSFDVLDFQELESELVNKFLQAVTELQKPIRGQSNKAIKVKEDPNKSPQNIHLNSQVTQRLGPVQRRFALIIGVDHYNDPNISNLTYCSRDAEELDKRLSENGYQVQSLHDNAPDAWRSPTIENIEAQIENLSKIGRRGDLVWFAFSGHGFLEDGKAFLAVRNSPRNLMKKYSIDVIGLGKKLREKFGRVILTLDACHAGVEMGRDLQDEDFIRTVYEQAEGLAILAASTAQQKSRETQLLNHGIFTHFLLNGLEDLRSQNQKEFITCMELYQYILDKLISWTYAHGSTIQEPTIDFQGLGDIILIDWRNDKKP